MQSTIELLEKALSSHPAPYWTKRLNLARNTLGTSKVRGHLSPAIAGALAEEMGEDAQKWMVIAALESEKESACKSRMLRKFMTGALAGTLITASSSATASIANTELPTAQALYYVK
ncbi:hypothetical protein GCM10010975_09670 [Comamonas phosphati]|nr:hypothetical protein GCM10010975_09670 [Comamonas phosphati]